MNNYAHIFDILIRLRQAVDHPYLVIHSDTQSCNLSADTKAIMNNNTDVGTGTCEGDCDLCHEPVGDRVNAQCGHVFCRVCIVDYVESVKADNSSTITLCPDCSEPLTINFEEVCSNCLKLLATG